MSKLLDSLENRVRKSIRLDVIDTAHFHSRRDAQKSGGFFGIPRHVFCHVNFLGALVHGVKSGTIGSELFIKEFFPPAYHPYAELLYAMYRHGTVHELVPKAFFAKFLTFNPRRLRLKWMINNVSKPGNRSANLKFFPMHGKRATLYFNVNTCQLADDLMVAFESFVTKLKRDRKFRRMCERNAKKIMSDKDVDSIDSKTRKQAVYDQIKLAWKTRSETVDEGGRPYPGT